MANLQDNIRVSTQVDMQQLDELILKYKDLKIRVSDVAAASRAISEQMKRDALEQANATKQATLELQRQQAAVKAVSNELIQEEKVVQQIAKTTESTSRAKTANIQRELAERRNLIDSLTAEDRVAQQVSITASQAAKAKTAAYNQETAAARALLAEEKILAQIERTGIAQKNNATAAIRTNTAAINQDTAAIRQDITSRQLGTATITQGTAIIKQGTAAIQQEKESVRLSTEQQRLYNQQLRNKALESKNASDASSSLFNSLNSLTKLRSELITLFGAYSIGSFAQQMVEAQSKVESFQLGMKNLLGEKFGAKLTDDLKKFTVETPLNFENVIDYTNKLVGAFKATGASSREIQEQVTPILESLGNTAAALGGGDRLGRLIYAFTQVQATGRLMGTEVRQITETGFPLLAVMAQQSGKSVQELKQDISDGKVGFEQFQKAILSVGKEGGVFAGAMDIMANTVQGRIDKLKEQVFFALSNIGNQFNDSAKKAVDFGASIIQSLFGTESATKRTIDVIRNAVIAWATYELIIRKNSAAQVAWNAIQRIGLIIKGEAILATEAYIGMTIAETEAQIAATTAARSFNATLAANPFGFALLALTALVTAYQLYSDTVDEAKEFTLEGVKANDSDVKSLVAKQSQLNATAKSALGLAEGTEGYRLQVGQLIKKYPEYFGHLNAEKASHDDIRKSLFFANNEMERKIKLMAQEKLAAKVADRSAELKLQIAEEEIANEQRKKIAENSNTEIVSGTMGMYIKQRVIYKEESDKLKELKLKDAQNDKLLQKVSNDLAITQQEDYQVRRDAIIKKWNNKEFETRKEFTDAIKQLDLEYGFGSTKIAESTGKAKKDAAEKALKYQADTAEQMRIASQKIWAEDLEDSRQKDLLLRTFEYRNQQERIKNAIGSQAIKNRMLLDLEQEYDSDITKLHQKWDERDKKDEKQSQEDRVKFSQAIDKILLNSQEEKEKESLKIIGKNNKEKLELDEKNSKESLKLLDKKYELMDNLRLLERVSQAKDSDEIVKIQKEENLKILSEIKEASRQQFIYAKLRLEYIKQTLGEESLEYSKQKNITLKLEEDFTDASINLEKEKTKQVEAETKKREEITKEAFSVIYQIGKNVLNDVFSIKEEKIKNELGKASSELDKFRAEQKLKDLETEKSTIGFFTSLASGDWVQAVGNLISVIRDLGRDTTFERQAALLKDQLNSLKEIMGIIDNNLNSIGSSFESIKNVYGSLFDTQKLSQFTDFSEKSIEDRIALEIKNGEQIVKNYETAASKENDLYNKKVKSIEDSYNLDIDRINKKYDLIDLRANQAYTRETLSILSNGSTQLEALIKNEESLSSVREELAAKRLAIENSFPLASKQIVDGMSQAEIDAINESIKARDEALSKLQKWYNDELTFIVNNEGQKRKQYSETEKIQLSIQENLDLSAIKFKADEIQREKDKADEIVVAQKNKNEQILIAQKELNDKLVILEQEKNSAILMSYMNLQLLVQAQVYQITGALVDSANLSAEAFAKLKQQLEEITNLYRVLTGGNLPLPITVPPFNIPVIPFEKGTDNTSISLSGQPIVDNRGGKPAILHPDEAVFSKANMSEMTKALGYRPSRDEVIEKFKMGIVNMKLSHSPYVIPKLESKGIGNVDKVVSELKSVANEMRRIQTPQVIMNERGIKTYLLGVNSKVQAKLDRFK